MDRSTVITLVSDARTQDETGVWRDGERKKRDVFAQVDSVTRSEFFEGGQNGLKPEFRFTLFFGNYEGESELIYNGVTYSIYRSYYGRNDDVELYVEKKTGVT